MEIYAGYKRQAQYYETDKMGIIHHSNYIRWFEEARVNFLEFLGLSYQTIEANGIIVPVLEVSCQYKNMLHFGDWVRIDLFIEKYTGTRLDLRYEIYDTNETLMTTGTSKHCFLAQENQRLISLKKSRPEFHKIFQNYTDKTANN